MASTTNRVVTLTSNTTPSPYGAAASSELGAGNEAYKAFDSADSQWITASTTTGWIYYDFGSSKWAADGYSIEPQDTTRAPKDWTFEGSNNASSWTVLDTQTGVTTWSTGVAKSYSFTNSTTYRYYRTNVSANNGNPTYLEIDEIKIFAPDLGLIGGEI